MRDSGSKAPTDSQDANQVGPAVEPLEASAMGRAPAQGRGCPLQAALSLHWGSGPAVNGPPRLTLLKFLAVQLGAFLVVVP